MGKGIFLLFNLGGGEIVFILLVVIMLFGAKRIPEIARGLGKGIREVKNAANDIKSEINNSTKDSSLKDLHDIKETVTKESKEIKDVVGSVKRNIDL
tara:strand:- start:181595 stop:181885 length:291 start_codon:yes stop_codon:yes gene_type:complete